MEHFFQVNMEHGRRATVGGISEWQILRQPLHEGVPHEGTKETSGEEEDVIM